MLSVEKQRRRSAMKKLAAAVLLASAMCAAPAFAQTQVRDFSDIQQMFDKLRAMQGKTIVGMNGEQIGRVVAIDEEQALAEVQMLNGTSIAVSADMLTDSGNQV